MGEGLSAYCYPGTNVLKNKLAIVDQADLDQYEAAVTACRIAEIKERGFPGAVTPDYLRGIHRFIFQDVYEWAGEYRSVGTSKLGMRFSPPDAVPDEIDASLQALAAEDFLVGLDRETFSRRLAYYFDEIHRTHPFREGNTRTLREMTGLIAKNAGHALDWSVVGTYEMLDAKISAYREGHPLRLSDLILRATDPGFERDESVATRNELRSFSRVALHSIGVPASRIAEVPPRVEGLCEGQILAVSQEEVSQRMGLSGEFAVFPATDTLRTLHPGDLASIEMSLDGTAALVSLKRESPCIVGRREDIASTMALAF